MRQLIFVIFFCTTAIADFTDVTEIAEIAFTHENGKSPEKRIIETIGSGAAFFDYDLDGFLDLYVVNSGDPLHPENSLPNRLYKNNGDQTLTDVTKIANVGDRGYGMGVAVGDYNNDRYPDLYVTNYGRNTLYHNNGNGTFDDVTEIANVGDQSWGTSAAFFDGDLDGDLDLYVCNYVIFDLLSEPCKNPQTGEIEYCHPRTFRPSGDLFYRNNGDGTFTDATREVGVYMPAPARGLGIAVADLNGDRFPDLYIANDTDRNFFFLNKGDGTFEDIALFSGTAFDRKGIPEGGMGVTIADFDHDGWFDIFVANTETNTLYKSFGDGTFADISEKIGLGGITADLVGFGTKFFDLENDGDLDLFIANGHVQDSIDTKTGMSIYPQRDQIYRNDNNIFTEISEISGDYFSEKYVGRGVAFGDYDNDGDLDLFILNCGERGILLQNDNKNLTNWIGLELIGIESNADAIGTKVEIFYDGKTRKSEISRSESYLSANDRRLIFGLGGSERIDEIKISWQSGTIQILKNIDLLNRYIRIEERK